MLRKKKFEDNKVATPIAASVNAVKAGETLHVLDENGLITLLPLIKGEQLNVFRANFAAHNLPFSLTYKQQSFYIDMDIATKSGDVYNTDFTLYTHDFPDNISLIPQGTFISILPKIVNEDDETETYRIHTSGIITAIGRNMSVGCDVDISALLFDLTGQIRNITLSNFRKT